MRNSFLSAAVIVAVFGAGFASAEQSSGKITGIDATAQSVTLDDGTVYSMSQATKQHSILGGYRVGDTVTLVWEMQGNQHLVSAMSSEFSDGVTGTIAAIDVAKNTIKLEGNSNTYTFKSAGGHAIDIGGYRAGDKVTIVTGSGSDANLGRAISGHKAAESVGKIRTIDQATNTVKLDNGSSYTFASGTNLGGYLPGDMVKIRFSHVGSSLIGNTISPSDG
jgi:Cu/Ag efflux protein CusF